MRVDIDKLDALERAATPGPQMAGSCVILEAWMIKHVEFAGSSGLTVVGLPVELVTLGPHANGGITIPSWRGSKRNDGLNAEESAIRSTTPAAIVSSGPTTQSTIESSGLRESNGLQAAQSPPPNCEPCISTAKESASTAGIQFVAASHPATPVGLITWCHAFAEESTESRTWWSVAVAVTQSRVEPEFPELLSEVRELRGIAEAARALMATYSSEYNANLLSWQRSGNPDAADFLNGRPSREKALMEVTAALAEYDAGGAK